MDKQTTNFWLGNAFLALALLLLLNLGQLWDQFGALAMGTWIVLVIAGVTLIMKSTGGPGNLGD